MTKQSTLVSVSNKKRYDRSDAGVVVVLAMVLSSRFLSLFDDLYGNFLLTTTSNLSKQDKELVKERETTSYRQKQQRL
jgi:hypothetical protein